MKGPGIHTLDDLKQRCFVDDMTGCWLWRGALSGKQHPSLYLPAIGGPTTAGVAICVLKTGAKPAPGVFWHRTCETLACCNPEHRKPGTRSEQMRAAKLVRSPTFKARIAATKQAQSKTCSPAIAAEIRASEETLVVVSKRLGVSVSQASSIRRGEMWRLGARAASVFAWGGS